MRTLIRIAILAIVVLVSTIPSPPALAVKTYVAVPLGALATNVGLYRLTHSFGAGVNNGGVVAGSSIGSSGMRAIIFDGGPLIDLGTLDGTGESIAYAINDVGAVVGESYSSQNIFLRQAFIYVSGKMTRIGDPSASSLATAINGSGQVVGTMGNADASGNAQVAFRYENGVFTYLGSLGGPATSTAPKSINDNGAVTGVSTTATGAYRGFLYQNEKMQDLGGLGAGNSIGYAINNSGHVVGTADTKSGVSHAFLYRDGVMIDAGSSSTRASEAFAINNLDQIVGRADTETVGPLGVRHAFLYELGQMFDLNSLVVAGLDGMVLDGAFGINDRGQIIADGNDGTVALSRRIAFRLDPAGDALLPSASPVVEFFNAALDHYFISTEPEEIADLDAGRHPGWIRTGLQFNAFRTPRTGANAVCRFYIPPGKGDSHFFSASSSECSEVARRTSTDANYAGYVYESTEALYVFLPDLNTGACRLGSVPVYRLWNGRVDSNHRYTSDPTVKAQMLTKGYVAEGYGKNSVAMCASSQ